MLTTYLGFEWATTLLATMLLAYTGCLILASVFTRTPAPAPPDEPLLGKAGLPLNVAIVRQVSGPTRMSTLSHRNARRMSTVHLMSVRNSMST
jgi:hypothetical protein